jgi:hypothetical protein
MSVVMMVTFTRDNSSVEGIEERMEGINADGDERDDDSDDRVDAEKVGKEPAPAERPSGGPPE